MLKITISGKAGSGKTTMAYALQEFLYANGFTDVLVADVLVADLDHGGTKLGTDMSEMTAQSVCIETVQEQRSVQESHDKYPTAFADSKEPPMHRMDLTKPRGVCQHTHTFSSPLPNAVWYSYGAPKGLHGSLSLHGCYMCGLVNVRDTNA